MDTILKSIIETQHEINKMAESVLQEELKGRFEDGWQLKKIHSVNVYENVEIHRNDVCFEEESYSLLDTAEGDELFYDLSFVREDLYKGLVDFLSLEYEHACLLIQESVGTYVAIEYIIELKSEEE